MKQKPTQEPSMKSLLIKTTTTLCLLFSMSDASEGQQEGELDPHGISAQRCLPPLLSNSLVSSQEKPRFLGNLLITECEQMALQGEIKAQYNLGCLYLVGQEVDQNYMLARFWFEKAARQGEAMAQHNLAQCYFFGYGGSQDYNLARYWYEKAALQDEVNAQYHLAQLYASGQGGDQDYVLARFWCEKG